MKNKESRARFLIIFSALLFLIILFADFYAIINYPDNFAFIIGFLVLDILCLFGGIYGLFMVREQKELRREEQYDSIFKSEKASYLMLRKYFDEITDRLEKLEKKEEDKPDSSMNEVIGAQKAAAKVIIGRNKENADAILSAADNLQEELSGIRESIQSEVAVAGERQKQLSDENLKEIMLELKDMEIRIHTALSQYQAAAAQTPISVVASAPVVPVVQENPVVEEEPAIEEELLQEEPVVEEEPVFEEELLQEEPVVEEEPAIEEELLQEEPVVEEEPAIEEELLQEEPFEEELLVEESPVEDVPIEEVSVEEAPVEEIPPMPDLSDPNKVMTPEEIAALIANI